MHNTMRMVLSNIHNTIPETILSLAFNPDNQPISIDKLIHEKVIVNRVMMDCNLVGGKRKDIVLTYDMVERTTYTSQEMALMIGTYSLYRIPEEARDYQPISSVVSVSYPSYLNVGPYDYLRPRGGATASKLANAVIESHTMQGGMITPTVELLSGDLVKLVPGQYNQVNWVLSCNLAYDENFNNLNPQAVRAFMDLTLCAAKAYIYNRLLVPIDQARIIHGSEHGIIKDIIYKYEAEEEKYKELLDEFTGGAMLDIYRQKNLIYNIL